MYLSREHKTRQVTILALGWESWMGKPQEGWESLHMVYHYAQMVDDDLLQAHKAHSPIDNLSRLK
jgi:hypothetical protein